MVAKLIGLSSLTLILIITTCFLIRYLTIQKSSIPTPAHSNTVTCKNENGEVVDWYFIYKLPEHRRFNFSGYEYIYIDSIGLTWKHSVISIDSMKSMLGVTLSNIYNNNISSNYLLYNDIVPGYNFYMRHHGRTKGIISWNNASGYWILHSIPGFPAIPNNSYTYPLTGIKDGQSILCITIPYKSVITILYDTIPISRPNVYNCSIKDMGALYNICNSVHSIEYNTSITWFDSVGGEHFTLFTKSDKYSQDMVSMLIAPSLKTHILSETRQRRGQTVPTYCSDDFHVHNIVSVAPNNNHFMSYRDNSKWLVSLNEVDGWVCIGDIDRSPAQFHRGGSYVCTRNTYLYHAMAGSVIKYESCKYDCDMSIAGRVINVPCSDDDYYS
ncbi:deoxyribonuclease II [Turkeypox virus]|uniref:Deoxyribonuclease II n=1 Tax=Turkeypox virus TaxID=336486 RepID=A0A0M5HS70_9POXV|nr:deoxyribonuclease II [Turkeypox virus]ALA62388.1 deoxyribonuclease II [Turkeypox virus]